MAIDKNKVIIAGVCFVIGFVVGFLVQSFIDKIVLLIAGFGLGIAFTLWLKKRQDEKKRAKDNKVHAETQRGIKK